MSVLSAKDLTVHLDHVPVIDGLDFAIEAGQTIGVIGRNGAGKTTLLRALAGLIPVSQGAISLDGQEIDAIPGAERARAIAYLGQEGASQWAVRVGTLVGLGRLPHMGPWQGPSARDREAVERAILACDLTHLSERPVNHLSGGERARVLLARALAVEPRFLLADEPIAGLDAAHGLQVMETLGRLAEGGTGVVMVVHDLTVAARYCRHLVLLNHGRIVAEGPAETVLSPENLKAHYGIEAHIGDIEGKPFIIPLSQTDGPESSTQKSP
jgi:iron complex transport system ATP-binding protein